MANNPKSLYIHIPFCEHFCSYCDFTKLFYNQKFEKPYLEALKKEISLKVTNKISTLYFGGHSIIIEIITLFVLTWEA